MEITDFIEQHILDCIRAAVVEAQGEKEKAARLRSQARLRLVCMTDEEVWMLAWRTSCPPKRSVEDAYYDIRETIDEYRDEAGEWLGQMFGKLPTGS